VAGSGSEATLLRRGRERARGQRAGAGRARRWERGAQRGAAADRGAAGAAPRECAGDAVVGSDRARGGAGRSCTARRRFPRLWGWRGCRPASTPEAGRAEHAEDCRRQGKGEGVVGAARGGSGGGSGRKRWRWQRRPGAPAGSERAATRGEGAGEGEGDGHGHGHGVGGAAETRAKSGRGRREEGGRVQWKAAGEAVQRRLGWWPV